MTDPTSPLPSLALDTVCRLAWEGEPSNGDRQLIQMLIDLPHRQRAQEYRIVLAALEEATVALRAENETLQAQLVAALPGDSGHVTSTAPAPCVKPLYDALSRIWSYAVSWQDDPESVDAAAGAGQMREWAEAALQEAQAEASLPAPPVVSPDTRKAAWKRRRMTLAEERAGIVEALDLLPSPYFRGRTSEYLSGWQDARDAAVRVVRERGESE